MNKEQKKENKEVFKEWRKYCSNLHRDGKEKVFDNFFELSDLKLIMQNNGSLAYQLQVIIKRQEEETKKEAYQAIINEDKPLAKKLYDEACRNLKTLEDRLDKLKSLPYYQMSKNNKAPKNDKELIEFMDEDIKNKDSQIKDLLKRIEKAKRVIETLLPLQEQEKEKNAVGRPGSGKTKAKAKEKDLQKEVHRAYEVLVQANKASASLLQRKLGIGYTKASRLLDVLVEQKKVIVAENGTKKLNISKPIKGGEIIEEQE